MTKHEVRMMASGISKRLKRELFMFGVPFNSEPVKRSEVDLVEECLLTELQRFKVEITEDEPIHNPCEGIAHAIS